MYEFGEVELDVMCARPSWHALADSRLKTDSIGGLNANSLKKSVQLAGETTFIDTFSTGIRIRIRLMIDRSD